MKNNYPVGDFMIRIKNAALAGKREFNVPETKFIKNLAEVLKKEKVLEKVSSKNGVITATIKYHKKEPMMLDIKVVSRPGLRIYKSLDELKKRRAATILILSTSKGILSDKDAIKEGVGGEVLAEIL